MHETVKEEILGFPRVYNLWQFISGGTKANSTILHENIDFNTDCSIIDFGCGTASYLSLLPPSINYWGCDGNAKYIKYASKKFLKAKFFAAKFDGSGILIPPPNLPSFDYALAFGVFHHLDDESAISLLMSAARLMKPSGYFISIDLVRKSSQNIITKFLNDHDRGKHIRYSSEYAVLAKSVFMDVNKSIRSDLMVFPLDLLIMKCSGINSSESISVSLVP